jgi:hypothetical protein
MAKNETVTPPTESTTVEALTALAQAIVKAGNPSTGLLTGMSEARLAQVRGENDKPKRFKRVAGKSPSTGATFVMLVAESRTFPAGRVVQLLDYRHPAGMFTPISEGGQCPDGSLVWRDGKPPVQITNEEQVPGTALSPQYKQWRYETYWQSDLRSIASGQPLRAYNCKDPSDMQTDWLDAQLWEDKAAE